MLIYVDSNILVYYLDATGTLHDRAERRLTDLFRAGDTVAVSDLTRLECRVGPLKRSDLLILAEFDRFFALPDVQIVPLTTAVYDRATLIRAAHNFKTPDSLHLAAAVVNGCDLFLTNDTRLRSYPGIAVEVLP